MRTKTPSFILELPLRVSPKEEKELLSRFESARQLYNAVLGEAKKRCLLVKQSKTFQKARKLAKKDKNRNLLFQMARDEYDFNEFFFHKYVGELRHNIKNNLDIHTAQKLATRAFRASERILFGRAKKVRFKGYNQLDSVESKSNVTGIRWKENKVEWNKLSLKSIFDIEDEVISHGLKHRVKYCRIFRKDIKNKNRFYIQLILEGSPYIKEKNKLGKGTVAFDFGPSTLAVVSKNENNEFDARLLQFCSELKSKEKEIRNLQQKIDRQRRQNNPKNYLANGKVKKGRLVWKKSKRQIINEKELKEIHRVTASNRKNLQGKLTNEVLRMGNVFKTEKVSRKWLQSLYGKSIGIRAPGKFVSGMKRKAESAGASFTEFPTVTTKLSQVCTCKRQKKKKLSERIHKCECGVICQRDLFSAFLALFVEKNEKDDYILQTDQAERLWSSVDKLLQTVWRNTVESTSKGQMPLSFGKPLKVSQSQSGLFVEGERAKFEVQNGVLAHRMGEESLKENKVFPLEPTGF
jgi:hypothetical protein